MSVTKTEPKKLEPEAHVHGPDCHHESLTPVKRTGPKVGRNDPCPCGSTKKFKKCCGQNN